ncbi:MAG: sigma-70 family RNA polymerase sigma factor [Gemmatimonadota bacterium]
MAQQPDELLETKRASFEREALPHLDVLHGFALRLVSGDEARAEDLVQEAMLRAYRAWHTFEPGTNCKAWLMTIVHNTMVNYYRSWKRRPTEVDVNAVAERTVFEDVRGVDPEGEFFDRIVDKEVLRAIDRLPLKHREAVVLRDVQGLTYAEMVQVLGVPEGTVKSRLFRARQTLQRELYDFAREMGYVKG